MTEHPIATFFAFCFLALQIVTIVRAILRPHREPASRIAWLMIIMGLPLVGVIAYLFLGEINIGRRRAERYRKVLGELPQLQAESTADLLVQRRHGSLFKVGRSINGFEPVAGNKAKLLQDSNTTIDTLVADIDAAVHHVHLLFYIWLPDNNGLKIVEALKHAAARKVACRALVDSIGSRNLIESPYWNEMAAAGIHVAKALPIGNIFIRPLKGRIDLRNHRKMVIVDNHITYTGSQNCCDPEFRIKAKFAPWVDIMIRFEGPIALQNQWLFISDWMPQSDENLRDLLQHPPAHAESPGIVAQAIGTGPTARNSAMPELFQSMMFAARRELIITTPYFVPDESMQTAICCSARRGVDTTIIFPARNDSMFVGAASRSYYEELLTAGVKIFEYKGGLLHSKTITCDGEITLMGSANMDRRSFELNYENNVLFYDPKLTQEVVSRQKEYLSKSAQVTLEHVREWTVPHRFLNNAAAMIGPVL